MANTTTWYAIGGKVLQSDNSDAFAMKTGDGRFYVKRATCGPDSPHLLNPWSTNFLPEHASKFDKRIGKFMFQYFPVSQSVFDMYIRYLETQNVVYYRNAERELD